MQNSLLLPAHVNGCHEPIKFDQSFRVEQTIFISIKLSDFRNVFTFVLAQSHVSTPCSQKPHGMLTITTMKLQYYGIIS